MNKGVGYANIISEFIANNNNAYLLLMYDTHFASFLCELHTSHMRYCNLSLPV